MSVVQFITHVEHGEDLSLIPMEHIFGKGRETISVTKPRLKINSVINPKD